MRRQRREPSESSEQELVAAARAGSVEAFGELSEHYRSDLVGFMRSRVKGDACRAEDLVQDTFVRAFAHVGGLRDGACFRSWLYVIANRTLFTSERTLNRHPAVSIDWMEEGSATVGRLTCASSPIEGYGDRELLIAAFQTLEPDYQRAFILRHVDGYSNQQIATIEGISSAAAQSRASRANRMMREQLDTLMQESERARVEVGPR